MTKLLLSFSLAVGLYAQLPVYPIPNRTGTNAGLQFRTDINTDFNYVNTQLITQLALINLRESTANKGTANGYAGLDSTSKVPAVNLPTSGLNGVLKYTSGVPSAIGSSSSNCVHEDGSSGACGGGGGGTTAPTQALGENTTLIASDAFVNNQVCSIAKFGPAADGVTNDSAIFSTAQATCNVIALTPTKQYFIGTNLTLSASLLSFSPPSGGHFVIGTGITLTLNGTLQVPIAKLFTLQGTGNVVIGPNTPLVYTEWFGALGDGATDDQTAIQNAINSTNSTVKLLTKKYLHSAVLSILHNGERFVGSGYAEFTQLGTQLINSATTGDDIDIGARATGPCTSTLGAYVGYMTIKRATPATDGKGISIIDGCLSRVEHVYLTDSFTPLYLQGSANCMFDDIWIYFSTSSGSTRNGIELDSQTGAAANYSNHFSYMTVSGTGNNTTGFYCHGNCGDIMLKNFETAITDYGIRFDSLNCGNTSCEDIHIEHPILDQCQVTCIYVHGNTATGPRAFFSIIDPYVSSGNGNAIGIDIENSQGVLISGGSMSLQGANSIGVKINNSQRNSVTGAKFDSTPIGISIVSSILNVISNNIFTSINTNPATTFIVLGSDADVNSIIGNMFTGYTTNAITIVFNALANNIYPNSFDSTNFSGAVFTIAAGAWGNTVNGPGGSPPAVATCGTIGTNSSNAAGFITSSVTGTCTPVITFDVGRMGPANNGWSCSIANSTQPANIIQQTGSTKTTATFSGSTANGDVLRYQCTSY